MKPSLFRWMINLYPPHLGAGVHVARIASDWSSIQVQLRLRFYNRNYVGTHYGGNLFTMTDPFYMIMLLQRLGPAYKVWDQKTEITYVKPGLGLVTAEMSVSEEQLDAIRMATTNGAKHFAKFDVDIRDEMGEVVARVHKTVYVREKPINTGA